MRRGVLLSLLIFTIQFSSGGCRDSLKGSLPPLPKVESFDIYSQHETLPGVRDAVVVAILKDEKVLMAQRGGEIGFGAWGLIGGKHDSGETLHQTLVREVREEVGLGDLKSLKLVDVHYHIVPEFDKVFRVFVLRGFINHSESPRICEEDKILHLGFFEFDQLPEPLFGASFSYEEFMKLLD